LECQEQSIDTIGNQADSRVVLHLHCSECYIMPRFQAKDAKAAEAAAKQAARNRPAQMAAARPAQTVAARPTQAAAAVPEQSAATAPGQDAQATTADRRSGSFTAFLSKRGRLSPDYSAFFPITHREAHLDSMGCSPTHMLLEQLDHTHAMLSEPAGLAVMSGVFYQQFPISHLRM